MSKSAPNNHSSPTLVAELQKAVDALRAAKKEAARLYGVDMPIEPEITRIKRYIRRVQRGRISQLSRRPASARKLRAAKACGKLAKGVIRPEKTKSSRENLQRWKDAQKALDDADHDHPSD